MSELDRESLVGRLGLQVARQEEELEADADRIIILDELVSELRAKRIHLEAVVEAWRELETARSVGATRANSFAIAHEQERCLARLVELNQIDPVREGEYLKLKDPAP